MERRRARKTVTQETAGDLLRDALKACEVSRSQYADWIGIADSGLDAILAGHKTFAVDDLLTEHTGALRVAQTYLRLMSAHVSGLQSGRRSSSRAVADLDDGVLDMGAQFGRLSERVRDAKRDHRIDRDEALDIAKHARSLGESAIAFADEMEAA